MGIILSALAAAGDEGIKAIDQQQKIDAASALQDRQAALTLQNETALLNAKQQIAQSTRQSMADSIGDTQQSLLDQALSGKAALARAMQLPAYDPSSPGATDPNAPASFHGDAREALAAVQSLPDGPDKTAAMAQLQQQVATQKAQVGTLTPADLTPEERARFAPTAQDTEAAYIAAAKKLGYISPDKALDSDNKSALVDAKFAQLDQKMSQSQLLHEAYTARTQAQFEAAMAKMNASTTMTPEMDSVAKGIAEGKLPPLSGYAARTPGASMIMSRVLELNPDYDATQYGTRQKAEKDFATGKNGNSVRSFNVALSHLDALSQLSDALDNGDTQMINKLGNAVGAATGSAAPTNFATAKQLVADEIVKAVTGSAGALGDREGAQKVLDAANSPAQLRGAIQTYQRLMAGQVEGMRHQYSATTGKDDFDDKYLSPEVIGMVKRFGTTGGAPAGATRISSDADFNALPSGATFVGPDGVTRRKP